ncbi:MAG: hydrogen gas-evolving membrane-bound hydrogenase subunit E [Thermodesulfobacteriota bacterium]
MSVPFLLSILILLPFLSAAFPFPGRLRRAAGPVATAVPAVQSLILATLWPDVRDGGKLLHAWAWLPDLGLRLGLALDGLSWLFACLIAGIGVLVFLYAASYLHDDPHLPRLYRFLLLFNGSMMGVVFADNLILLSVFWELTSISSFLLIGFRSQRPEAGDGATKALLLTAGGGLVMLFGIFLVFAQHRTFDLSVLLSGNASLSPVIGGCFLVGAFTKSAQFPFHIWLPSAMEAPTPVSAYLHAATMVKAGLYLVARLSPLFAGDPFWSTAIITIGGLTLLWGGMVACKQTDLKALLAYSTVSQLGLIMLLLGLRTETAFLAALLHIVNHAAFKGALFLTAGAVEHATGTRDLRRLGGLRAAMPLTTAAALLATLSMAGLPPLGGFVSKELFYDAVLGTSSWLPSVAVAASAVTFLYSFLLFHGVFFAPPPEHPHAHETPAGMLIPVATLSGLALAFGLAPALAGGLIDPAVAFLSGRTAHVHLALWHGLTPALGLSVLTIAIGGAAFLWRDAFIPSLRAGSAPYSFDRAYRDGVVGLNAFAVWLRTRYMTGHLTDYVAYLMAVLLLGAGLPLWWFYRHAAFTLDVAPVEQYEIGLALLMATGGIGCCLFRSRVPLVLSLGLVGTLVSIFFVLFSAPDLALTQILVESVGLVLFLLVFRFLSPIERKPISWGKRGLHLALSVGSGLLVALLLLAANIGQLYPSVVTPFYLSNSYLLAGGRNVVNVIVVDFRGYDTMGEITVFSVAALAVFAMIRLGTKGNPGPTDQPPPLPPSVILRAIARLTLHLMLLFSVYLLLRGHNAPGGGFIAGMLTAVAVILQMVAFDLRTFVQEIPWNPLRIVMTGLAVSASTGLGALFFGYPFLTSAFGHFHLPVLGEVEVVTAVLFDFGVYLVVIGTTLGIIRTIAEE